MYVCLCLGVTDRTIEQMIAEGKIGSLKDLQLRCKAGTSCGTCICEIKGILAAKKRTAQESPDEETPELSTPESMAS